MFKLKLNKNQKIDTLVDARTRIDGDVQFAGGFHLDGCIKGNISAEQGADSILWVSDRGQVEGSVTVSHIVLNGVVTGDIDASGRVELGEKARVFGNVRYNIIESAVGAQINGKLIHRAGDEGDDEAGVTDSPTG